MINDRGTWLFAEGDMSCIVTSMSCHIMTHTAGLASGRRFFSIEMKKSTCADLQQDRDWMSTQTTPLVNASFFT